MLEWSWLQCCDSLRWAAKGLSRWYTCVHSSPNPSPIKTAAWHWAEFPVLFSRSLWVVHFKYSSVILNCLLRLWSRFTFPGTLKLFSRNENNSMEKIQNKTLYQWSKLKAPAKHKCRHWNSAIRRQSIHVHCPCFTFCARLLEVMELG